MVRPPGPSRIVGHIDRRMPDFIIHTRADSVHPKARAAVQAQPQAQPTGDNQSKRNGIDVVRVDKSGAVAKTKAPAPQVKRSSWTFASNSSTVIVEVGPDREPFTIHKKLLTMNSSYFRGCYEGGFKESQSGVVHLEETNPDIFSFVVEYLYKGNIKCSDSLSVPVESGSDPSALQYIDIWKLADYLDVPGLQNLAMRRLFNTFNKYKPSSDGMEFNLLPLIRPCYENTMPDSPLRSWIADLFGLGYAKLQWSTDKEELKSYCCEDFLFDVHLRHEDHFDPYELDQEDRDDIWTLAQYKVATVPAQKVGEEQMPDKQAKPDEEPSKL